MNHRSKATTPDDVNAGAEHTSQIPSPRLPISTGRTARYGALGAVPLALAAEKPMPSDTGGVGDVLDSVAGIASDLFAQQPLLAAGLVAAGAGTVCMKTRKSLGLVRALNSTGSSNVVDDGFATKRDIRKTLGRRPLVERRGVLRPSLAGVPARRVPTSELALYLGRDRKTQVDAWLPIEDSTVIIAPMGAGKTAKIANWLIDHVGPVLATSSKHDIVELTEPLRAQKGRVRVWNPQQLADRVSDIAWDPVIGCADPESGIETCMRRALYLLEGSDATKGLENRTFWMSSSYKVLKSFLWAAAVEGLTLLDVARWSKRPQDLSAIEIFKKYGHRAPRGWAEDLEQAQMVKGKPTTTENVFGTLSQTFMFLDSPRVQEIVVAAHASGAEPFDILGFLRSQDTLYMLGRDDAHSGPGPLFTALTGEIYEAGRLMASRMPGGRLDAPYRMILDEAALICSVPLQKWTADSRGLGIGVDSVFQSPAQIHERWGKYAYQTIWDNCTKLILGGLSNEEHIEAISRLTGIRRVREETYSRSGPTGATGATNSSVSSRTVEKPTLRPHEISGLSPGEILILRRHIRPLVVRFEAVWERKDIKALKKDDKKQKWLGPWFEVARRDQKLAIAPAARSCIPGQAIEEEPWTPPAPETSPWTTAPAPSGWSESHQ
ncbi:type IV secretory system conjugative DNA transfer family protein [Streptomyces hygroscopicus]|uniref:type IV secretory system conjugative DNA transfer family protein n=1 Tax=Streptomyces hygroscopicus TaxID=1912 RepID=UPI00363CA1DA